MQTVSRLLNRIGEAGLVVAMAALAIAVFLQVLFRYVLDLPLFWTEEFARYCLIWASLLGAGVALFRGQHLAMDFFVQRFPPMLRWAAVRVSQLAVAAILVVVVWGGVELMQITKFQLSPALRIPMSYPYMAIPSGALIMLVHVAAALLRPVPTPDACGCRL
jgi:TRAP-type transport system small permease protein